MHTKLLPVVACLCLGIAVLPGCGIIGNSRHAVGECVHTMATFGGMDIKTAECPTRSSVFEPGDPVYRITEVLDLDGHCSAGTAFGGIELKHEPDDVVYCPRARQSRSVSAWVR